MHDISEGKLKETKELISSFATELGITKADSKYHVPYPAVKKQIVLSYCPPATKEKRDRCTASLVKKYKVVTAP